MNAEPRLRSVQILRAVAVLLVVAYHGATLRELTAPPGAADNVLLNGLFLNGYAGVDLFFVISGFIMVGVSRPLPAGLAGAAEFLFARATRIYPLWWAAATFASAYYAFLHLPAADDPAWRAALREGEAGAFLVKSFLLLPQADFPVLSVGWTLIHEIYFYLVFAFLLLLPRPAMIAGLAMWGGLVLAGALSGLARPEARDLVSLAVHPLTLEFLMGAAGARILQAWKPFHPGLVSLTAAVWLAAMICYHPEVTEATLQWQRVLLFGLPAALLVYGLAGLEQAGRLGRILVPAGGALACAVFWQFSQAAQDSAAPIRLQAILLAAGSGLVAGALLALFARARAGTRLTAAATGGAVMQAFVRIGDWSYTIYLGHIFVIAACLQALKLAGPAVPGGPVGEALYILAVGAGTVLCGWLGHALIERPVLLHARHLRRVLFRRAGKGPAD